MLNNNGRQAIITLLVLVYTIHIVPVDINNIDKNDYNKQNNYLLQTHPGLSKLKDKHPAFVQESKLRRKLFDEQKKNPLILPVKQLNETMTINFKVYLTQIIHLEEKSQIMKTNVWLQMEWNDHQYNWKREDYGGLDRIIVTPKYLWKPDVVLFNNADGKYEFDWQPNLILYNIGSVVWIPPAIYISSCRIEVEYFPFDQQDCDLKFGSLTFNSNELNFRWIDNDSFLDLSDYWKSGTWDVIDVPGRIETVIRNGNETMQIVYTITLRRKTLFYTVNLILPCVMISMLSICVFYLPADAGEKMTLCISILFALVVFLLLISKILPPTSTSIPLISRYLLFTFIMNIFAILFTMVIINWNYRTTRTHAMPKWVRIIFMEILPKILRLNRPIHVERDLWLKRTLKLTSSSFNSFRNVNTSSRISSSPGHKRDESLTSTTTTSGEDLIFSNFSSSRNLSSVSSSTGVISYGSRVKEVSSSSVPPTCTEDDEISLTSVDKNFEYSKFILKREISDAANSVNYISSKMHEADEFEDTLSDWKYVASVVDRLMLIIFTIITVLATVSIFTKAPFIFDTFNQKDVIAAYSTKKE